MDIDEYYLTDALGYSSGRRALFVKAFQQLAIELGAQQIAEKRITHIAELIHCSATIVDDMLDNESSRKGVPSYYIRHGRHVAAFASLNLMVDAIERINEEGYEAAWILESIRKMIDAEAADVGLVKRLPTNSPIRWYEETSSKKIAHELNLILKLCLRDRDRVSVAVKQLYYVAELLGQFIQFCDDWRDVLIDDPFTNVDGEYSLTYSLPLAIHLTNNKTDVETFIGKRLDKNRADSIITLLRSQENIDKTANYIQRAWTYLMLQLEQLPLEGTKELKKLASSIQISAFGDNYNATAR